MSSHSRASSAAIADGQFLEARCLSTSIGTHTRGASEYSPPVVPAAAKNPSHLISATALRTHNDIALVRATPTLLLPAAPLIALAINGNCLWFLQTLRPTGCRTACLVA